MRLGAEYMSGGETTNTIKTSSSFVQKYTLNLNE